ncbi:uncharacterized protein BT62DRAFT_1006771 [Guyanagaster necrorhizus]|uniref:Uncharacterized protein n=1 Tax=Guyanagaster necrorhizus TaxID=856835 RepID=A0A9P8ARU5_9AGAR|nr:uncharacterized protein BT62DRAFT_1006771 [Guyanagaster necrorhizus MCA 3950]KAG7445743.1 hypothetical protein BT62DRAFT_1006771 [Guyanagaster necrorhizus MCA 3950]
MSSVTPGSSQTSSKVGSLADEKPGKRWNGYEDKKMPEKLLKGAIAGDTKRTAPGFLDLPLPFLSGVHYQHELHHLVRDEGVCYESFHGPILLPDVFPCFPRLPV